jgi:hypothetical protein
LQCDSVSRGVSQHVQKPLRDSHRRTDDEPGERDPHAPVVVAGTESQPVRPDQRLQLGVRGGFAVPRARHLAAGYRRANVQFQRQEDVRPASHRAAGVSRRQAYVRDPAQFGVSNDGSSQPSAQGLTRAGFGFRQQAYRRGSRFVRQYFGASQHPAGARLQDGSARLGQPRRQQRQGVGPRLVWHGHPDQRATPEPLVAADYGSCKPDDFGERQSVAGSLPKQPGTDHVGRPKDRCGSQSDSQSGSLGPPAHVAFHGMARRSIGPGIEINFNCQGFGDKPRRRDGTGARQRAWPEA